MARHRAGAGRPAAAPPATPAASPTAHPTSVPSSTPTLVARRATGASPQEPSSAAPRPLGRRRAEAGDPTPGLPRQEQAERHPSGPLPRLGRARHPAAAPSEPTRDPHTTPLDLAAIALAAGERGTPWVRATQPGTPSPAGRAPGRRGVPLPTRTAGALALVGALAGGGVAVVGGGTMLAADRTPDASTAAAAAGLVEERAAAPVAAVTGGAHVQHGSPRHAAADRGTEGDTGGGHASHAGTGGY